MNGVAVLAVCLGACAGALLRWALSVWLNPASTQALAGVPLGTLAANWMGAYLVGVVVAVLQQHPGLDPTWRLALITGFLGALTTFSTFSIEVVTLLQQQRYLLAAGTAGLHLLGSLALTVLGLRSVAWWVSARAG